MREKFPNRTHLGGKEPLIVQCTLKEPLFYERPKDQDSLLKFERPQTVIGVQAKIITNTFRAGWCSG